MAPLGHNPAPPSPAGQLAPLNLTMRTDFPFSAPFAIFECHNPISLGIQTCHTIRHRNFIISFLAIHNAHLCGNPIRMRIWNPCRIFDKLNACLTVSIKFNQAARNRPPLRYGGSARRWNLNSRLCAIQCCFSIQPGRLYGIVAARCTKYPLCIVYDVPCKMPLTRNDKSEKIVFPFGNFYVACSPLHNRSPMIKHPTNASTRQKRRAGDAGVIPATPAPDRRSGRRA